jgi:hypothetical protein
MGLFDILGTGDQQAAAQAQTQGINYGLNYLTGDINQGNQALQTNYTNALQPFLQNQTTANQGTNALGNALGLNGPSGNAAATAAFTNNPGYQFQLQQGNNAINAAEAASGKNFSGNQLIDLSNYNQGLAGTTYQNYVNNLQPYLGLAQNTATGIGNVDTGLGQGLNANYNTLGNANYGAFTSIGNANANADLAGLNASANGLGALLGIGKGILGFLSDERVKEDIEKVGELYDGQPIFKYRYLGDPRHQIGLIAQNVEEDVPDATFDIGHLKGVDYDRATRFAADLGRYL